MGKGPPPGWSRRDCRFDHLVTAAMERGFGITLVYSGIDDEQRAHDIRRGIYRCSKHRGVSADAGPARVISGADDEMGVRRNRDGTFTLRYRIWKKSDARKRHLQRHGPDRAAWPYNPRRRATDAERESWANRDEHGRIIK